MSLLTCPTEIVLMVAEFLKADVAALANFHQTCRDISNHTRAILSTQGLLRAHKNPERYIANLNRFFAEGAKPRIRELSPNPGDDNFLGLTPIHHAASVGSIEAVDLLLAHGAEINAPARSWLFGGQLHAPMTYALIHGHVECATHLLACGAEIQPEYRNIFSPIYCAAQSGAVYLVALLINLGADVERLSPEGVPPYFVSKTAEILQLLWFCGTGMTPLSPAGESPRRYVRYHRHAEDEMEKLEKLKVLNAMEHLGIFDYQVQPDIELAPWCKEC